MSAASRGNIKMALSALRSTRSRSFMTMFGVIVGVASVVTVVGLGEGVQQQLTTQAGSFGKDLIIVRPGTADNHDLKSLSAQDLLFGMGAYSSLGANDIGTVAGANGVAEAVPLGVVPGTVKVDNGRAQTPLVVATNEHLPDVLRQGISDGSFFSSVDTDASAAVMGSDVAQRLFQEQVPLGRQFVFRGQTFTLRGIFKDFSKSPLSPTAQFNDAIFIPYQTAEHLTNNSTQFYTILAKPAHAAGQQATMGAITQKLTAAHGGEQDFSVLNERQALGKGTTALSLMNKLIIGVAAISLFVGGVGIMNIMLLSVTERLHEIGVRKAIGATSRQILNQFILEATVLSVVGGVIGILLSLVVEGLLRTYSDLQPTFSWHAMTIALVVSIGVGVFFGAAPAAKAAHKDPIEALRRGE